MGRRVLIIEDNEQNIYLETFLLEKAGFEAIQARDGQDGIDKAISEKPDLILLDIQLPVMDGYKVARLLKANAHTKKTPIIAVTSYAMKGDKEKILGAGCEGYIEKPINPDSFVDEVKTLL